MIALSLAVLFVVLILLLPRSTDQSSEISESMKLPQETIEFSEQTIEQAKSELDEPSRLKIQEMEQKLNGVRGTELEFAYLDSMALLWQYFKQPAISAEYRWKSAEKSNTPNAWFVAGDAFFSAYQIVDENKKEAVLRKAIAAYESIQAIDADNLSALNALGVAYVEGAQYLGEPPMKGIGMIREVLAKDPENIDALVNLGYFAIKSGQYDKAVERFNTVLKIDPSHIEAYLYLTDIYVSNDEIEKAIQSLNKYKEYVQDEEKKRQIETYIKDLENNR